MISALATRNKVNILSTPRLTVLDNREATIQVGQDVPTVTSEIASAAAHVDLGNQCCKEYPVPQHGCHVKG
jgi:general secretion pathway protein D